jgi:hypothetical protein
MNLMGLGLMLAVLPTSGEVKQGHLTAPVTVYIQFEGTPNEAVLVALQDEVATIMAPIGLHFEWRSLEQTTGRQVAVELVVATFKGRCEVDAAPERSESSGALGWTHTSNGEVLPFTDVECDRIGRLVSQGIFRLDPEDREEVFGRAVGRVLAHEPYHIFLRTGRHGSWGIAKAHYSAAELLAEDFRFEERESKLLRGSKLMAVLEAAAAEDERAEMRAESH